MFQFAKCKIYVLYVKRKKKENSHVRTEENDIGKIVLYALHI